MNVNAASEQTILFLYSSIFGLCIGVYYDVFRIMRYLGINSKISIIVQDLFFMITIAPATYIFFIGFNGGAVRIYILFAELLGAILYRYTLGRFSVKIIVTVIAPAAFVLGIIIKFINRFICYAEVKFALIIQAKQKKKEKDIKNQKKHLKNQSNVVYNVLHINDKKYFNKNRSAVDDGKGKKHKIKHKKTAEKAL